MKKLICSKVHPKLFVFFFFLLTSCSLIGEVYSNEGINDDENKANELSLSNESGFIENKGQMTDMNGNLVPFVLFKAEAPGLNFWITDKGFIIEARKWEKIAIDEKDKTEFDLLEEKRTGKKKSKKILYWEKVDVELSGANICRNNIIKEDPYQGYRNYFYSNCPDGLYGVNEYEKITIKDVYSGIDWVFYRKKDGSLKYEFIVHPGADYRQIELVYRSKNPIIIDELGCLVMMTEYGNIKENSPVSYYENVEINSSFQIDKCIYKEYRDESCFETKVRFHCMLPENQKDNPESDLIIDPSLMWGTFKGGNDHDGPYTISKDASGNFFISGYAYSSNFPVTDPGGGAYFQGTYGGGTCDGFIWKFNSSGGILWSTYYGGTGNDYFYISTVDQSGNLFVTGSSTSADFPLQDAGTFYQSAYGGNTDMVILKFNNSGVRLWATYYGGTMSDIAYGMCSDPSGNIFLTGSALSGFPIYNPGGGAYYDGTTVSQDVAILKFNNSGNRLWATFFGGNGSNEAGYAIASDASGNIFVTGNASNSTGWPLLNAGTYYDGTLSGGDAFIAKFNSSLVLQWSTYYGGTGTDCGYNMAIDGLGNLYVAGVTASTDIPVQDPGGGAYYQPTYGGNLYDAFLLKFDNSGNRLWATYVGGTGYENIDSYDNLSINSCNNVAFAFHTQSSDLTVLAGCDGGYNSSFVASQDQYVCVFNAASQMIYSTYIGGDGADHRAPVQFINDNLIVSGEWTQVASSATYPLVDMGGGAYYDNSFNGIDDGFLVRLNMDVCYCVPLPVELTVFNGKNEGTVNKVYWETMSELNCDYYELQRAIPNSNENSQVLQWNTIGIIEGSGTTSIESNYEFYDDTFSKEASVIYYRLNQVDYNGSTELFGPIAINLRSSDPVFDLFPNPVTDELNIHIQGTSKGNAIIVIENVIGEEIACYPVVIEDTNFLFSINLEWLSKGIYFIKFKTDDGVVSTEKLVVK